MSGNSRLCKTLYARIHKIYYTGRISGNDTCKAAQKRYGEDIGVVFVGPCIAKKNEADKNPSLIDVSLTFHEAAQWFEQENIVLGQIDADEDVKFVPKKHMKVLITR